MDNQLPLDYLYTQVEGYIKEHTLMPKFFTYENLQNEIKEAFNIAKQYEEFAIIELIKKVIHEEYEDHEAYGKQIKGKQLHNVDEIAKSYYRSLFNK